MVLCCLLSACSPRLELPLEECNYFFDSLVKYLKGEYFLLKKGFKIHFLEALRLPLSCPQRPPQRLPLCFSASFRFVWSCVCVCVCVWVFRVVGGSASRRGAPRVLPATYLCMLGFDTARAKFPSPLLLLFFSAPPPGSFLFYRGSQSSRKRQVTPPAFEAFCEAPVTSGFALLAQC